MCKRHGVPTMCHVRRIFVISGLAALLLLIGLLVLVCVLCSSTSSDDRKCNGAREFCELPLDHYSFPGTHNSGAFKLSTPSGWQTAKASFLNDVINFFPGLAADCLYENHKLNYLEQLQQGVRLFEVDSCWKDSKVYNCHSRDGTPEQTAFGEELGASLISIYQWLMQNPNEIVAFTMDNNQLGVVDADVRNSVENVFGECLSMDGTGGDRGVPKCLRVSDKIPSYRLGDLIGRGLRFVFVEKELRRSYWDTVDSVATPKEFSNGLLNFAETLADVTADDESRQTVAAFSAYRTLNPDLMQWRYPKATMIPMCYGDVAMLTNEELLPNNDQEPRFDPPVGTICDGVKCLQYRSILEVAHLELLRKGYTLGAVTVDFSNHGSLIATMNRINMVNFRKVKGLPEPGIAWYEQGWVRALFVGIVAFVCLASSLCLVLYRPTLFINIITMKCCATGAKQYQKSQPNCVAVLEMPRWQRVEEAQHVKDKDQYDGHRQPASGFSIYETSSPAVCGINLWTSAPPAVNYSSTQPQPVAEHFNCAQPAGLSAQAFGDRKASLQPVTTFAQSTTDPQQQLYLPSPGWSSFKDSQPCAASHAEFRISMCA